MIYIYGIILTIFYSMFAFIGYRDIFSPRVIFNLFAWVKNVPYFVQIGDCYSEELQLMNFSMCFLSMIMVNVGMSAYEKLKNRNMKYIYYSNGIDKENFTRYYQFGIIIFIIGFLINLYVVLQSGGLFFVLSHLQARGEILRGFGYATTFSKYMLILSVILVEYYMFSNKSVKSKLVFCIIFASSIFSLIIFGARKPALMLLILTIMVYHYCYKKIKWKNLISFKFFSISGIVLLFMLMMPMLRYKDNSEIFMSPIIWLEMAIDKFLDIFREFSYLTGVMFTYQHFNIDNYWFGRVYLNILYQWIPSSIYPNKPPMDDGMYLYNMMRGFSISPNMARIELFFQTSVPFTQEGALYANFGVLGIVIGSFMIGIFYKHVYRIMLDSRMYLYNIFVYQVIMFEFVPSVLHSLSPMIGISFAYILFKVFLHMKCRKRK